MVAMKYNFLCAPSLFDLYSRLIDMVIILFAKKNPTILSVINWNLHYKGCIYANEHNCTDLKLPNPRQDKLRAFSRQTRVETARAKVTSKDEWNKS